MRISLLLFYSLFSLFSNAQINNVRVYSDDESSCYLNQINDSLITMTFEQYPDYDGYLLGVYQIKNDSIIINEITESISLKRDTYFWNKHDIHTDSLLIEYFLTDYILGGTFILDSLNFEIDGSMHPPTDQGIMVKGRSIIIKRPTSSVFVLNIFDGLEKISSFKIAQKEGKRAILIREAMLNSIPAFITNTFEELVPNQIMVQNKNYYLTINLAD